MRFSRSLVAAAFACSSALLAQVPAQAQVVEVPFNGGVLAECEEVTVIPGELRPDGPNRLNSQEAGFPGSGAASAELEPFICNSPAVLQLDSIVGDEANAVPLNRFECEVIVDSPGFFGGTEFGPCDSMPAADYGTASGFISDTTVDLVVTDIFPAGPLPAGDYSFTVNFNLIPN